MWCRSWISFTLLLSFFIILVEKNEALGTIYVKFLKYDNPTGLAENGHCCDGKYGVCTSACDNMFEICFDHAKGTVPSTTVCRLGKYESTAISNQNSNRFGATIGQHIRNPIELDADEFPETFQLKVLVKDKDSFNKNDQVDFLSESITVNTSGTIKFYSITARTKLTVSVQFECDPDWYGPKCNVLCENPSNDDHYGCNRTTGAKICNEGWVGSECSLFDSCFDFECQNLGKCVIDEDSEPTCICSGNFSGPQCEFQITTAAPTTVVPTTAATTTEKIILPVSPEPGYLQSDMDCEAIAQNGKRYQDGLYDIQPDESDAFEVWCDMSSVGWTVIQRRYDDDVSFNRDWESYKKPFGDPEPNKSYWIGLENLYRLTNQRWYKLSITIQMPDDSFKFANYHYFYIENEENGYRLHIYGQDGTAGDALIDSPLGEDYIHNFMKFSTFDQDNDRDVTGSCAQTYQSGWWFNNCYTANLNGVYKKYTNGWPECEPDGLCISWMNTGRYSEYSISSVIMKVLPTDPPSSTIIEAMNTAP